MRSCGCMRTTPPRGTARPRCSRPCGVRPWPGAASPGTPPPRRRCHSRRTRPPPWPTRPGWWPPGWRPRLRPTGTVTRRSRARTSPCPCTGRTRSSPPRSAESAPAPGNRCGPRPSARRLGAMPMTPAHAAYLRHPDVRGDLVTFTAANAVWLAPLAGGRAWPPPDEGAPVGDPRCAPDGAHGACTARAAGGPEVWVIPTEGDTAPRRLTAWGRPSTKVAGWLPDGRILATSSYGAPIARDAQLWAIDLDGTAELLPLGRSGEVAIHPSGTTVVATPWRRDQASWKHYQGGTAVKLWVSREDVPLDAPVEAHAARSWEPLLDEVLASKLRIAWYGDRLLFA